MWVFIWKQCSQRLGAEPAAFTFRDYVAISTGPWAKFLVKQSLESLDSHSAILGRWESLIYSRALLGASPYSSSSQEPSNQQSFAFMSSPNDYAGRIHKKVFVVSTHYILHHVQAIVNLQRHVILCSSLFAF